MILSLHANLNDLEFYSFNPRTDMAVNSTNLNGNETVLSGWSNEPLHSVIWGWPGCPYPLPLPPRSMYEISALWIWRTVPLVLIVIGTLGNALTVAVICRQPRKISSTGIYFLALSIVDTVFLYAEPFPAWVFHLDGYNIRAASNAGCKVFIFLAFSSYHSSAWILVAVTTERAYSIIHPYTVRRHCTEKSALIVTMSIIITMFIVNAHLLYGFGSPPLDKYIGYDECMPAFEKYSEFFHSYWTWVHFLLGFVAPFVIIMIGNTCVIRGLHKMRTNERRMESESLSRDYRRKLHHANHSKLLTLLIILLNVVFFISQMPLAVYLASISSLIDEVNVLACTNFSKYKERADHLMLYEALTYSFAYLNPSVNFILYVLSGSRFRNEILHLLTCTPSENQVTMRTTSLRSNDGHQHHNDIRLFM